MLKEAIEKMLSLAPIQTFVLDGRTYTKDSVRRIKPPEMTDPAPLLFNTLKGLVDYIQNGIDGKKNIFLHVAGHAEVSLLGHIQPENNNARFKHAESVLQAESYSFGAWIDLERFIIAIQSMFVPTDITSGLIDMLGCLANENIVENKDDGFSQTVQVKSGITTKSSIKIENPLLLKPYRTFREVDQPKSNSIFRLRKSHAGLECALFESDGGQWKLDAVQKIHAWLSKKLGDGTTVIS